MKRSCLILPGFTKGSLCATMGHVSVRASDHRISFVHYGRQRKMEGSMYSMVIAPFFHSIRPWVVWPDRTGSPCSSTRMAPSIL